MQDPQPSSGDPGAAHRPVLDGAALAGLCELDPEGKTRLVERVFAAFRTSTARLIPQLIEAHRMADLHGMRHVAHTLKSSAASVGGLKLSAICAQLESCIRLGVDGDLTPQVDALVGGVQELLDELEHWSPSTP